MILPIPCVLTGRCYNLVYREMITVLKNLLEKHPLDVEETWPDHAGINGQNDTLQD
jgi:hypothetical protein